MAAATLGDWKELMEHSFPPCWEAYESFPSSFSPPPPPVLLAKEHSLYSGDAMGRERRFDVAVVHSKGECGGTGHKRMGIVLSLGRWAHLEMRV